MARPERVKMDERMPWPDEYWLHESKTSSCISDFDGMLLESVRPRRVRAAMGDMMWSPRGFVYLPE